MAGAGAAWSRACWPERRLGPARALVTPLAAAVAVAADVDVDGILAGVDDAGDRCCSVVVGAVVCCGCGTRRSAHSPTARAR